MSKRSYDTESLTIRQVFAYNSNNSFIPALRCLTSDGVGGTYWSIPSSLGGNPAYNKIQINNSNYIADLSYNTFTLNTLDGLGVQHDVPNKRAYMYSKGFTQIDVSGGNTVVGYSNNTVTPTIKLIGKSGVRISSDPLTNNIFFEGIPVSLSTGAYAFGQINVISNASTVTNQAIGNSNNTYLTATDPSSILTVLGAGDIKLITNTTSNAYFISISTFTSAEYLQISSITNNSYGSTLSTVSSLFYDEKKVGAATSSLLDYTSNVSTGIKDGLQYLNNYVTTNFVPNSYFYPIYSTNTGHHIAQNDSDIDTLFIQIGLINPISTRNVSTSLQSTINNLSTLSSSVYSMNRLLGSTINFYSSLRPTYPNNVNSFSPATNVTFSTTQFRLDSLSSLFEKKAKASVKVNPTWVFSSNATVGTLLHTSTFIMAGNTYLPSTLYTKPWIAPSLNNSNLYYDSIQMNLENTDIMNNITSNYTICHSFSDFSGSIEHVTGASNATSQTNSLFVNLYS